MFQSSSNIIPRWYQAEAIDAVYNYFMSHSGNPLIGLPCGTGKSCLPALFIKKAMHQWPDQRFLLMTSVSELIKQNSKVMYEVWPNVPLGVYSAGLGMKQSVMPVVYAGIQSAIKDPIKFGHRDMIWIDEAQLVSQDENSQYLRFISAMKLINPYVKIVGMSGTLFRMGQGYLTDNGLFTDVIYDMTTLDGFNRLLAEGYLCPLVPRRTRTELDVSNVGIANGDYVGSQLQKAVDINEITYSALREAVHLGHDRKSWLIFASGIDHSDHIAELLQSFGVECASVHSKQTTEYNNSAIRAFKNNQLRAISSYSKLAVGFDHPPVDLIIDLRPTISIVLHVQKYCRGSRPAIGKKDCMVLDFARNTQRLGFVNDPIIPKKKGSKEGDLPVKICEACGTYNHLKVRFCTNCGNEFHFQVKIIPKSGNDEIIRSDQPIIETFDVHKAIYQKKQKDGKPAYIKATYFTGMLAFDEFIFPEATKVYMKHLYHRWWMQRHASPPPLTTDEVLRYHSELRVPKRIRVHCNKQFPEIKSVEF